MPPWIGMLLVLAALLILMPALKRLQSRFSLHPEVTRKLLHTTMGMVTLGFPWLFTGSWPVWTLAALSSLLLLAVKLQPRLKQEFGDVVGGVRRRTLGDLYFPLAVALTFELADGRPLLFIVPVAMLSFADAVAALIGLYYGRIRYRSGDSRKTLEGSIAFFVVAFFSAHLPLTLLTELGALHILLISLLLAMVVMLAEGMASRGLDNLFIPLGGYFLLSIYLQMTPSQLGIRLLVLALLSAAIFYWRRNTLLDQGAAIAIVLLLFVTWSLRPWQWLLPPLLLLAVYSHYVLKDRLPTAGTHSVDAILAVSVPALSWITLSLLLKKDYLFSYSLAYGAHLAITGVAHFFYHAGGGRHSPGVYLLLRAGLPALLPPAAAMATTPASGSTAATWLYAALTGMLCITGAAWLFKTLQPKIDDCPVDTARWIRQAGIASVLSIPGLLFPF